MKSFREAEGYAADLQSAYDYYRTYSPAAATQFLTAYFRATKFIERTPLACRLRRHGWRQMIIPGHPNYTKYIAKWH